MMKDQKGITLVALIITIIVMLILVAVTISVALNGGLFTNARDARNKTIDEQAKEAVTVAQAEIITDYYSKGTALPTGENAARKIATYLGTGWTVTDDSTGNPQETGKYNFDFISPSQKEVTDIPMDLSSIASDET